MRRAPVVALHWQERREVERLAQAPASPPRRRFRARIVLRASEGASNKEIAGELRTDPATVARWRHRFLLHGVAGIVRDAPRTGRPRSVPDAAVGQVIRLTLEHEGQKTARWSTRHLADLTGISRSTVHRIWKAQRIGTHRPRIPPGGGRGLDFLSKVTDMVGLYLDPPERALAFSTDERLRSSRLGSSELRALRNAERRDRGIEFRAFLQVLDRETPSPLDLHLLLDSRQAPGPPLLQRWLGQHPRFHLHYLPSDPSGETLIDRLVAEFSRRRPRTGESPSAQRLRQGIRDHFRSHRGTPAPFVWTTTARESPLLRTTG